MAGQGHNCFPLGETSRGLNGLEPSALKPRSGLFGPAESPQQGLQQVCIFLSRSPVLRPELAILVNKNSRVRAVICVTYVSDQRNRDRQVMVSLEVFGETGRVIGVIFCLTHFNIRCTN